MEKEMTNEESLRIIEEMIAASKTNYKKHHGIYFLFWGYLAIGIILLFLVLRNTVGESQAHYVWPLFFLGFLFNFLQMRKNGKSRPVVTKVDKMIGKIWLGVSFGMAVLFGASPILGWKMLPMTLLVMGIATYTHGAILGFKPFVIGAFVLLIMASVSFYMPDINMVLGLFVAGVFFGYITPAHLLRNEKED